MPKFDSSRLIKHSLQYHVDIGRISNFVNLIWILENHLNTLNPHCCSLSPEEPEGGLSYHSGAFSLTFFPSFWGGEKVVTVSLATPWVWTIIWLPHESKIFLSSIFSLLETESIFTLHFFILHLKSNSKPFLFLMKETITHRVTLWFSPTNVFVKI